MYCRYRRRPRVSYTSLRLLRLLIASERGDSQVGARPPLLKLVGFYLVLFIVGLVTIF